MNFQKIIELLELSPRTKRKRRPGAAGMQRVKQCPPGYKGSDGNCTRIAGGEKSRSKRLKKQWRRSGAGHTSARKQKRWRKRFGEAIQLLREELELTTR